LKKLFLLIEQPERKMSHQRSVAKLHIFETVTP
jgi:hypothetical protein